MISIWLPCTKDIRNQGLTYSTPEGSYGVVVDKTRGKVLHTTSAGSIDTKIMSSDGWDISSGSCGFGAWLKFNLNEMRYASAYTYTSSSNVIHNVVLGWGSYGGFSLDFTSNNIYSDGSFKSATLQPHIRFNATCSTGSKAIVFDEWHHWYVQYIKNRNALEFYYDGEFSSSASTASVPISALTKNFMVNNSSVWGGNPPSRYLPYYVSDIRVYNKELPKDEIKNIASGKIFEVNSKMHFDKNVNLLDYSNIRGHGSSFEMTSETFEGMPVYRNSVTNPNAGNNAGFSIIQPITPSGLGSASKISISFYKKLVSLYGKNLGGYVRVVKSDATEASYSWSYNKPNWANDAQSIGKWEYITSTVTIPTGCTQIKYMYVYTDRATGGACDFSKIQLELNGQPTQYCLGSRPETAFSLDGVNTIIGSSGVTQSGNTLYFNGTAGMLYDGVRISGGTMSIWINTQKKSTQFMYADSVSHMGMTVYSAASNNSLIIPWIGPSPGRKKFSSSHINWSSWNHIVVTFNSACEPVSCFINGLESEQNGTDYWSGTNTDASIGMRANGSLKYTGYIGNVKIFAKEFSSDEIVELYNKERVKYQ